MTRSDQPSLAYPVCKSCVPKSAHPESPKLLPLLYHRTYWRSSENLSYYSVSSQALILIVLSEPKATLLAIKDEMLFIIVTELSSLQSRVLTVCLRAQLRVRSERGCSVGAYLHLQLIVIHVCHSSVSHHWPSRAINQESPLCLTKSQWAASITEPALPTHEYSPNETISYHNTGLEVAEKNERGCTATGMLLRLFLSLKYVQLRWGAHSGERKRKIKKKKGTHVHIDQHAALPLAKGH